MSRTVEVLKVDTTFTKTPKGGYNVRNVSYNDDGKTKGMRVLDFVQKDVYTALEGVKGGDYISIELEKNDKDFWQFKSVTKADTPPKAGTASGGSGTGSGTSTSRGNWETSEERAARQVMIVRQSSLSTAVALAAASKEKATCDSIIENAKVFEAYVMGKDSDVVERGDVQ